MRSLLAPRVSQLRPSVLLPLQCHFLTTVPPFWADFVSRADRSRVSPWSGLHPSVCWLAFTACLLSSSPG